MLPLSQFNQKIDFVLTDIDDTLTSHGTLTAKAYEALWTLKNNNIRIIPVTGRPAGWCDLIARLWPVDAVIGENGGLYYRYHQKKMIRWNFFDEKTRIENQNKLKKIAQEILSQIPNATVAADQFSRIYDLAIDFAEDVDRLPESSIHQIVKIFESHHATAKISSIHVNGWFGNFNKVTTALHCLKTEFGLSEQDIIKKCAYLGDSPNDEPLFQKFQHSFGVANIKNFESQIKYLPKYISTSESGNGFCEIIEQIIKMKN